MENKRIAINGFGRIGRVFLRAALNSPSLEIVAINDITDIPTLVHLFKYDSVHGRFGGEVKAEEDGLRIDGKLIKVYSEKDPAALPWKDLKIDVVVECTGLFLTREKASKHLHAGAGKVVLSAPAKSDDIPFVVLGVNDQILKEDHKIISNSSCTTNCAAPMVKILEENFGIESCYITTVHSYTSDQRLHDSPHRDLRRARAAAVSIIPTSTGAAKAITKVFPQLDGKMGGAGIRVPVPDGSLTDITCIVKNAAADVDAVNDHFRKAADTNLEGILEVTDDPVVSIDIVGNTHSCIFDPALTSVIGNMVKVVGWYDNEAGYSNRLKDLVERF